MGVPPNMHDCEWRIQPPRHYVEDKKLKKMLKNADWLREKEAVLPEHVNKHTDDERLEAMAQEFARNYELESRIDIIIEIFESLRCAK